MVIHLAANADVRFGTELPVRTWNEYDSDLECARGDARLRRQAHRVFFNWLDLWRTRGFPHP